MIRASMGGDPVQTGRAWEQTQSRRESFRRGRRRKFRILFLTVVLLPALAVASVGAYGLAAWVYQMIAGPPGPRRAVR
jgi:periplasmic nitrate reductase NapE